MDTYYLPSFKRFNGEILIVTIDETQNNTVGGGSKRTYLQFEMGPHGQERQRTLKIEVGDEIKVTKVDLDADTYKSSYNPWEKERAENEIDIPYWVFPYNINTDQNASLIEEYNKYCEKYNEYYKKYNETHNKKVFSDKFVAVKKSSVTVNNEENTYYDFVTNEYDQWQISGEKYSAYEPSLKKPKRDDTSYTKWSYRLKL